MFKRSGALLLHLLSVTATRAATSYSSVTVLPRMGAAGQGNGNVVVTGCPYSQAGLTDFASLLPAVSSTSAIVLPTGKYLLSASVTVRSVTISPGAELIFADSANLVLSTQAVVVQGKLTLGSSTCPLKSAGIGITLTGTGDFYLNRSFDPLLTKGITVNKGGVWTMYGVRYAPTWTKLAAAAIGNQTQTITLMDAVDWQPGQQVMVATSAWHDKPATHQNELRTILAVSGKSVTLDRPLLWHHYGGPEYFTEVAMLTRTITIAGDVNSTSIKFGGQTICLFGSQCRFSGVAGVRLGQQNVMGRYPFHLHMMGDVNKSSWIQDSVVTGSFFRAFTIHGTSNSRLSRNIAYDIAGSAYYLEDAVEENNLMEFNLAAHINIINVLSDYGEFTQAGVLVKSQPNRIVPTDATAVGFYCTNGKNRWVGNAASGGFAGFQFPVVPKALGNSALANPTYKPDSFELLQFEGNSAHSTGYYWSNSACIYIGGHLTEATPGQHDYVYQTGRANRAAGFTIMNNTKVWGCQIGVLFWGSNGRAPHFGLNNYEAHDIVLGASQLGDTFIFKSVLSAFTGNIVKELPKASTGFQLYDTGMQTIFSAVAFRNFNRTGDVCITDLTFSNTFKPQGMFSSKALSFAGTPWHKRFAHLLGLACNRPASEDACQGSCTLCPGTAGSSQLANIIDTDGSAMSWPYGPAILGADDEGWETNAATNDWWKIEDGCYKAKEWGQGFWACPTRGTRAVVSLQLLQGIRSGAPDRITSLSVRGLFYHFGRVDRRLQVGLADSPQVTGPCCDVGWFLQVDGGALPSMTIFLDQMVTSGGLVFATAYPVGAALTIQRCVPIAVNTPATCVNIAQVSTLSQVQNGNGTTYFVDQSGVLYVKFLFQSNQFFSEGGVTQLRSGGRWYWGVGIRYTITSSLSGRVPWLLPAPLGYTGTWTVPATTTSLTTTISPSCTAMWANCLTSRCCSSLGARCYQKDKWWAACRTSCDVSDGWTCVDLGPGPAPTIPPPPVWTTATTTMVRLI